MTDDEAFEAFEEYCTEVTKAADEWQLRWPQACKSCLGAGGHGYTETHGFTGGGGEHMWDTCTCVGAGNCPRCGTYMGNDEGDEVPCPSCKWSWGRGKDDACPEI